MAEMGQADSEDLVSGFRASGFCKGPLILLSCKAGVCSACNGSSRSSEDVKAYVCYMLKLRQDIKIFLQGISGNKM